MTLAVLALAPAAANATVTTTKITTPSDPVFAMQDDTLSGPQTFAITGTSDGVAGADKVDINCYYWRSHQRQLLVVAEDVDVQAGGGFSAEGSLSDLQQYSCVLRAVPANDDPTFLRSFEGPSLNVGRVEVPSSYNEIAYDWGIDQSQPKAYTEWSPAGDCGFFAQPYYRGTEYGYLFTSPWQCAATLGSSDGIDNTSEIVVDGKEAYDAYNQHEVAADAAERSAVSRTFTVDPANGNLRITETSPIKRCEDTDADDQCDTWVPTGLTLERTIMQEREGQMATVTDTWNADSAAHKIRLSYDNRSAYDNAIGYRLPGDDTYARQTTYSAVEGLPAAPATINVRVTDSSDTPSYGGLTYTSAPDGVIWTDDDEFIARYTRDIPAGGSLRLTHIYTVATSDAEITALSHAAEDKVLSPSVSIASPANGSTVTSAAQTVTGTATDNGGVKSLTVNGQAVVPGPGGAFSAPVTLQPGQNTITVVAADAEGNSTQAQSVVTYVPPKATCKVPNVTGKKLDAAKKAIKKAGCVVGKVRAKASKKVKRGRVISQGRKGGASVAVGTKVKLTVSKPKAVKKQTSKKH